MTLKGLQKGFKELEAPNRSFNTISFSKGLKHILVLLLLYKNKCYIIIANKFENL